MTTAPYVTQDGRYVAAPRRGSFPRSVEGRYLYCILLLTGFYILMLLGHVGSVSLMGVATVIWGTSAVTLILLIPQVHGSVLRALAPLVMFGGVMLFDFYINPIPNKQVAVVLTTFLALTYFSANYAFANTHEAHSIFTAVKRFMLITAWLNTLLYIVSGFYVPAGTPRAFSVAMAIGIGTLLIEWRDGNRRSLAYAAIIFGLVVFTLSRTATLDMLLLVPLSSLGYSNIKRGRLARYLFFLVGALALFFAVLQLDPTFQRRFFFGKTFDQFMNGNASLDTAGRDKMWAAVYASWNYDDRTRILGRGVGSAGLVANLGVGTMLHPHNDYLRLLHDTGLIGAGIFTVGLLYFLWRRYRMWKLENSAGDKEIANVHGAAFLALTAFALIMITDNPIDYLFAVTPVGILLGCSVGYECARLRQWRRR